MPEPLPSSWQMDPIDALQIATAISDSMNPATKSSQQLAVTLIQGVFLRGVNVGVEKAFTAIERTRQERR